MDALSPALRRELDNSQITAAASVSWQLLVTCGIGTNRLASGHVVPEVAPMGKHKLVREELPDGRVYEYVPLGKHIVSAPSICRGRPTFKYTRVEIAGVLEWLGAGNSVQTPLTGHGQRISLAAIQEATALAGKALVQLAQNQPAPR